VGGFKVGPRLALRFGADLITELAQFGPVFLDNKYFDIPSTTEAAVRASFDIGASLVTVHASIGEETLKRLAQLEGELSQQRPFQILAVTVLTSFSQSTLPELYRHTPISEQVLSLARLSQASGIRGLVCSALELPEIRSQFPKSYVVVPGIRLEGDSAGDQKRVIGPKQALSQGASALVIGRPVLESKDPRATAQKIHDLCLEAIR